MEEISSHISELLFDHDCVIVPNLGGFLASNQPTKIILPKHIIYPPYRHIAFNVFLKHNDGLLANHLVEVKNINYNEALLLIENFTSYCFDTLERGKKFILTEIGTLYYDKEKNLQFEPFRNFNHLKDSFGMESVNFLPIQRGEQNERNIAITEKTIRPSIPPDRKKLREHIIRNRAYIGAILIGAAMCWFAINLYLVGPKNYESTSLNPFDSQETILPKKDPIQNTQSTGIHKTESETVSVAVPSVDTTSVAINTPADVTETKEAPVIDTAKPVQLHPAENTSLPSESSTFKKHYVIAGVFKIRENAERMLNSLKEQGFVNAQIIEIGDRNYVSFENATSREGALAMIDTLQKKKLESWIWKH